MCMLDQGTIFCAYQLAQGTIFVHFQNRCEEGCIGCALWGGVRLLAYKIKLKRDKDLILNWQIRGGKLENL